MATDGMAIGFT